jgi:glutamate/tyrosine decarboxylase-like PLP-dependent enzyme
MDEDIAAGCRPMMVVGTGGSAARLADAPEDLHDLDLADSVAREPHKWLYVPMEAG